MEAVADIPHLELQAAHRHPHTHTPLPFSDVCFFPIFNIYNDTAELLLPATSSAPPTYQVISTWQTVVALVCVCVMRKHARLHPCRRSLAAPAYDNPC